MSLLWRERLVATLTPERVHLRRESPFWRRASVADQNLACPDGSEGAEPWRASLNFLAPALDKNVDLAVVLSSHFVRLQLLPWQAELKTRAEWQAYGTFRFQEIYGSVADAWDIVLSNEPPGRAVMACAVDRALLDALKELAGERGGRLVSVQPAFALAWNRHRKSLGAAAGAFVLAEPGRLCAGLCRDGAWFALRNQSVTEPEAGIGGLLAQQLMLADMPLPVGEVLVVGLDGAALKAAAGLPAGWRLCGAPAKGGTP